MQNEKEVVSGNSLAVQWLGLCTFTAEGTGSIPGRGTKIPQATWHGQKQQQQRKKREVAFIKTKLNVLERLNKSKSLKPISDELGVRQF